MSVQTLIRRLDAIRTAATVPPEQRIRWELTTEEARAELAALIAEAKGIDPSDVLLTAKDLDDLERKLVELERVAAEEAAQGSL